MKLTIAVILSVALNAALSAATLVAGDTPEVAAAKAHHAAAHAAARASLPVLPQDYHAFGPGPVHVPAPVFPSIATHPQHHQRGFTQFAEEIPLSPLGETPEVAAARAQHLAEYAKVRSALPEIPIDHNHHAGVHHAGHVVPVHHHSHHHHHEPISRGFTQFAEEIPLSPLGETPEVAAARAHHLAELARVRSILPEIPTQFGPGNVGHVGPVVAPVFGHNGLVDTPEVAAARAAHAAAHAHAQSLLG